MKAMIWKELRENVKWAVLAMIGLTLAEIYGLYYYDPNNYYNRGVTLCNPTFLMATSLGNAVVGLVLGLVQILPEQRRDQWAALLHRPVSRSVIFRGKAVAGLFLYLVATLPPFLLCCWLAATPGHFAAPFVPDLILPGLSDIFVGAAYYFAALTVGLQRGSWFGARTFALLAAVYLSCSLSGLRYFYIVTEAAVVLALLLFAAAWGAMDSNGKFSDRPRLTKAALLLVVFFGACGVGTLASILFDAIQQPETYIGAQYRITQEGQPIIVSNNKDLTTTVTDLAGNPVHDTRYTGGRSYENFMYENEVTIYIGDSHQFNITDLYANFYNYRQSNEYVDEIPTYGEMQPIKWFYLNGPKYTVGIDQRSKALSQFVDRNGFHSANTPIEPFTGTLSHWYNYPCLVQEGNDAFMCDLEKQLYLKLPSTDPSPVFGLQVYSYQPVSGKGEDWLATVGRAREMQIYDSNGAQLAAIPYNPQIDLDRWGMIWFGVNRSATGYSIRYQPSIWLPSPERMRMPSYLDAVDTKGTVLHSYTLPPLAQPHEERSWKTYLSDGLRSPAFWYWTLAYHKIGATLGIKSLASEANSYFNTDWPNTRDISGRVVIFSILFAAVALVWARRAGMAWPRVWAWTAFVFAFNIGGLITFRAVADWPVQVPCPSCQRSRRVEEPLCSHCHAGWPRPEPGGFEIFEVAGAATVTERTA